MQIVNKFKDRRTLHMLHGILSEQEYCPYVRDSVSERMNKLYMFLFKYIAIGA